MGDVESVTTVSFQVEMRNRSAPGSESEATPPALAVVSTPRERVESSTWPLGVETSHPDTTPAPQRPVVSGGTNLLTIPAALRSVREVAVPRG